jgi:RNA-directed DNA polymerase
MAISSIKYLAYILKCKSSEGELMSICAALTDNQFQYDKEFYWEIVKTSEKNGRIKTRKIHPSTGRLKLIQGRIKKQILDSIKFPEYVQGANKGYSNITNARLHLGKKFKFTTDIRKFFPSIGPSQVYNTFCQYGFKPEVSRVLTILTTYKGKIPQGASTSAHIANMVFNPIDKWIDAYCKERQITYSRYIDDVTLSSQRDIKHLLPEIINQIIAKGFIISSAKTQYRHLLDITGISVGNNKMKPNKKFYDKLNEEQSEASKKGRLAYLERVIKAC